MALLKVFDVLDTKLMPAAVYKVGLMTADGEAQIVKWTVREDDNSKFICHKIFRLPERMLPKALSAFDRYIQSWELSSCIVRERIVKSRVDTK